MITQRKVKQHLSEGKTAIVVAVDGRVIGMLFAADTLRPAASAAVAALRQRGLDVKVVSGDRKEAVWAAAAAAGVPKEATSWAATPGGVGCDSCCFVGPLREPVDARDPTWKNITTIMSVAALYRLSRGGTTYCFLGYRLEVPV